MLISKSLQNSQKILNTQELSKTLKLLLKNSHILSKNLENSKTCKTYKTRKTYKTLKTCKNLQNLAKLACNETKYLKMTFNVLETPMEGRTDGLTV